MLQAVNNAPAKKNSSAKKTLVFGIIMTIALVVASGWTMWRFYGESQDFVSTELQIRSLVGEVARLDEVMTMNVRIAVATGNTEWESRYKHDKPRMDETMKELIRLTANSSMGTAVTELESEYSKLLVMRDSIFALIRAGQREKSVGTLMNPPFEKQRGLYDQKFQEMSKLLTTRPFSQADIQHKRLVISSIVTLILVIGLIVCWIRVSYLIYVDPNAQAALEKAHEEARQQFSEKIVRLVEANEKR